MLEEVYIVTVSLSGETNGIVGVTETREGAERLADRNSRSNSFLRIDSYPIERV
ncbi:hypothetical protein [Salinigranum marinum]|uniref:hypothetical protein n=1 Tax=Salinigranum marinum TaxID=1515595 RepID=UPI002989F8D5|nr:hypothetical protein [Salinigranum marinum]